MYLRHYYHCFTVHNDTTSMSSPQLTTTRTALTDDYCPRTGHMATWTCHHWCPTLVMSRLCPSYCSHLTTLTVIALPAWISPSALLNCTRPYKELIMQGMSTSLKHKLFLACIYWLVDCWYLHSPVSGEYSGGDNWWVVGWWGGGGGAPGKLGGRSRWPSPPQGVQTPVGHAMMVPRYSWGPRVFLCLQFEPGIP